MQLCSLTLRLGGSLLHTVPKMDVTPAEILILQHIHGSDATVDIRPTRVAKDRSHQSEWERLSTLYDRPGSLSAGPGDEARSIMVQLFPGAMKKLPTTLKEIGLGHIMSPSSIRAAEANAASVAPVVEDVDLPVPAPEEAEAEEENVDG